MTKNNFLDILKAAAAEQGGDISALETEVAKVQIKPATESRRGRPQNVDSNLPPMSIRDKFGYKGDVESKVIMPAFFVTPDVYSFWFAAAKKKGVAPAKYVSDFIMEFLYRDEVIDQVKKDAEGYVPRSSSTKVKLEDLTEEQLIAKQDAMRKKNENFKRQMEILEAALNGKTSELETSDEDEDEIEE